MGRSMKGTEGCLAELTFVITGVLDSLELDQTEELVRKYGRKATHSDVFPEPVESGITRMEDLSEEDFERLHPWALCEVIALFERNGLSFTRRKPFKKKSNEDKIFFFTFILANMDILFYIYIWSNHLRRKPVEANFFL
ncbi:uncharacterized protein LOC136043817 isoform X2 [Artemia franciscana]|uniref:uncharacterized protein LOC136043817 isoform X2 n=1 Tax=Artemia franciscana TaxID=6661 RepID=UPI0032DB22AF